MRFVFHDHLAFRSMSLSPLALLALWLAASTALLISTSGFSTSENAPSFREIELTPALVSELTPKLSNANSAAQLDILDQLVFGKGTILRVEGKSRKYLLLTLDSSGKQFVKLFDLSSYDLEDLTLRGVIYFNGVLSKMELRPQGPVEASITYSRISSGPGHAYSEQAKTFVLRNWESRRQNREILNPGEKPAPASTQTQDATASRDKTNAPNPKKTQESGPSTAGRPAKSSEEDDDEDSDEPIRNKPVLLRRDRSEPPPPSQPSSSSQVKPAAPSGLGPKEDDVVIYRKKAEAGSSRLGGADTDKALSLNKEQDGMMLIPEGYVTLGSDQALDKEKPLHRVPVRAFYLDKYEVTNREFKDFCDATGHRTPAYWKGQDLPKDFRKHPVAYVKWQDALAYAKWVGKRLPTEAEWERAAKGPNSFRYSYGNAYDPQKANTESKKTTAVGSFVTNEFGLCDMTGNVAEWTSSLFKPYPYKADDGREDPESSGPRVLRGGSSSSGEANARCLVRMEGQPDEEINAVGFRCARDAN